MCEKQELLATIFHQTGGLKNKSETSKELPVSLLSTFIQKQKSKLYHGEVVVGPNVGLALPLLN